MRVGVVTSVFAVLLLAVPVLAATTLISGQQTIDLAVQAGKNHSFYLVFTSVEPSTIAVTGDVAGWAVFAESGNSSHTFTSFSSLTAVQLTIKVPAGTTESEVRGFLTANGVIISQITVAVVPPLANITALRSAADVNAKVESLRAQLQAIADRVNSSQSADAAAAQDLAAKIDKLASDQKSVASLEQENAQLEARLSELRRNVSTVTATGTEVKALKQELDSITGRAVGERNFSFAAGFLLGAVIVFLLSNRRGVKDVFSGRWRLRVSPNAVRLGGQGTGLTGKIAMAAPFVLPPVILLVFLLL